MPQNIGPYSVAGTKTLTIATFRSDYEYKIEYEYEFGISIQLYPLNHISFMLLANTKINVRDKIGVISNYMRRTNLV